MAEQHLYINYSVEDIEKYLQGRMNAKDMHELERAALQDPFLADAIEGYRHADFGQTYQHLDDIALAITGAKQPAKIVAIPEKANYWWRVAIAIGLIVIAGGAVWYSQQGGQAENKALAIVQPARPTEKVVAPIPPAAIDSAAGFAKKDTAAQLVTSNANKSKENEVQLVITEAPATIPGRAKAASPEVIAKAEGPVKSTQGYIAEDKNYTTPVQVLNGSTPGINITVAEPLAVADTILLTANNGLATNASTVGGYSVNNKMLNNNALPLSKQTGPYSNQLYTFDLKKQALFNVLPSAKIEGYIRDDKQQPLPNAMVYAGNRLTAITDARGYFRLNTPDSQLTVQVSSAGYETKTALLKGRDSNAITINQLYLPGQGIEVTSFKSRVRAKKVLVDSLAPEGGWQSFREYVYKKLHKEKDMDTTGAVLTYMPGSVEIEFVVDENGTAKEFRITKSLNKESDAKALDVVRQWPRWITARRNAKGKVVIEF
jgi:TonB family protein